MNLKLTFITLIGLSISAVKVEGLKCYVCGDEGESPCEDFEQKKDIYAKECVAPYNKGCAKHTEDNIVVRKCSYERFDDCKLANGVEYCYCLTDLCNSNISKLLGPTDDEDLIEGSGIKTIPTGTERPVVNKDKSSSSRADLYCSLVLIPFVALFYNK